MRRIIFASILLLSSGVAFAGPHGGGGGGGGGGVVVRDHRGGGGGGGGGVVVRDHYGGGGGAVVRDHRAYGGGGGVVVRDHRGYARGPIHVTNGRYVFPGGVVRVVGRPVIHERYYNYYSRPGLIVENYDPVPGYVWVRGNWRWSGAEWMWTPGYFSVGASVVVD